MSIGLKQSLNLSQSLVMTPQLQQAIKLLQLSRMELENLINSELVENPVLEETADSESTAQGMEESAEPVEQRTTEENPQASEDFNWESYIENTRSTPNLPVHRGNEEDLPTYENTLTAPASLTDHLIWQLKMGDFPPLGRRIGEVIIGNLNEDGYLQTTIEEIAVKENVDVHEVEATLYQIQQFDPIGVGARDLKECLLVQVDDEGFNDEVLERIIENHLTDLEKKNYQTIARTLGISLEDVIRRVRIIEELEPKPGRAFGGAPAHYIIPDIYIVKRGTEYVVMLNEDGLPKLKISSFYKNLLDEKALITEPAAVVATPVAGTGTEGAGGAGEALVVAGPSPVPQVGTEDYVQGKLRSAVWLIRSIHQRQRTIYKVTESIVRQQRDFFDKGVAFLKPMVLRDVANDIGMHESTISRVTTNKYVHTPRGIFELKYFFNSGISRVHGGDVASESVKEKVKSLIAAEPPNNPLSDQKIVEMLLKENINIARRTVAKYREMLGILPSSRRRKTF
ncbi:MAG: RNA polymerase sigma-54 factor [Deltaproteobacteria bacterium]|nr:RNA polymerase sigma-54 factor [Deltaproteobacteria bacterium]